MDLANILRPSAHLDKQIGHLTRHNLPSAQVGISVRRLEKFSNAEETALKSVMLASNVSVH